MTASLRYLLASALVCALLPSSLASAQPPSDGAIPEAVSLPASSPADSGSGPSDAAAPAAGASPISYERSPSPSTSRQGDDDGALLRRRISLMRTHRLLGIATWGAMAATVVLGAIQFYNQYGFFSPMEETPCVQGSAIFGQGQCSGTPWLHLGAALLTTGLYTTTAVLAQSMPVPKGYAEGPGRHARKVRLHRLLRWVHLGGMAAQLLLGYVVANGQRFTLDRANDYGTLRTLSAVHLGVGLITLGALTWAGSLFL